VVDVARAALLSLALAACGAPSEPLAVQQLRSLQRAQDAVWCDAEFRCCATPKDATRDACLARHAQDNQCGFVILCHAPDFVDELRAGTLTFDPVAASRRSRCAPTFVMLGDSSGGFGA